VFAVLLWFVLLPGPCGALLYRLSLIVRERWGRAPVEADKGFATFAIQSFSIIDWLPVRVTASAFAVVGDFEDAAYCWRTQAAQWPDRDLGIVLAAGAGALGVQLGRPVVEGVEISDRAELGWAIRPMSISCKVPWASSGVPRWFGCCCSFCWGSLVWWAESISLRR
jgi:cobalamin biosynthesis protein CobD/CbiB